MDGHDGNQGVELEQEGSVPTRPKDSPKVTAKQLHAMIEAQGYRCALSGVELTPKTTRLDHKTAYSRGGEHSMDNLWFVHVDVNNAKGQMSVDEFLAMCRRVVAYQS